MSNSAGADQNVFEAAKIPPQMHSKNANKAKNNPQ